MNQPEKKEEKPEGIPTILPPSFLKIIALPMSLPSDIAKQTFGVPESMDPHAFEVAASLAFLALCYFLFPSVVPILIFSGIAQYLLLVSSQDQNERVAGGAGMFALIIFCISLSQGLISL